MYALASEMNLYMSSIYLFLSIIFLVKNSLYVYNLGNTTYIHTLMPRFYAYTWKDLANCIEISHIFVQMSLFLIWIHFFSFKKVDSIWGKLPHNPCIAFFFRILANFYVKSRILLRNLYTWFNCLLTFSFVNH